MVALQDHLDTTSGLNNVACILLPASVYMVVFTPEAPVPENQVLRDIEKALAEFRGFEMTPEQRGVLAKYIYSKIEIRTPPQKK